MAVYWIANDCCCKCPEISCPQPSVQVYPAGCVCGYSHTGVIPNFTLTPNTCDPVTGASWSGSYTCSKSGPFLTPISVGVRCEMRGGVAVWIATLEGVEYTGLSIDAGGIITGSFTGTFVVPLNSSCSAVFSFNGG